MLRLGVVGCGHRAEDLRIVGIVDPDEAGVRRRLKERDLGELKFYKTLDAMVRKARLDGVVIATRCHQHARFAVRAAKYDIPLYLEKPVAINMRQATALEKAFSKTRCKAVVSFPLRVSPLCRLARNLITDGAVGTPQHVHAVNYVPYGTVYTRRCSSLAATLPPGEPSSAGTWEPFPSTGTGRN